MPEDITLRTIQIDEKPLIYSLERKNVKNINLHVRKNGSVYVSANTAVPAEKIDAFLVSKAGFILNAQKKFALWYSSPCNFNDVFDCDISIDEKEIFNSIIRMVYSNMEIRVGSPMWKQLRQAVGPQIKSFQAELEKQRTTTGISCLSEEFDSLLMWAHYANNHRGMCVEYELLEINKQLGFSPVPIIYSDNRVSVHTLDPNALEKDIQRIFIESLTSKSPEWSYEKEWRIIRDDGACGDKWDAEKKGALLEMIRPSSIILGCMAKPEFEKAVREHCEECKINLYKMKKDKERYRLEKIPVILFDD